MKIVPLNSVGSTNNIHRGFLWSLNPFIAWMRFIGIELNASMKRSCWRYFIGLVLLVLNMFFWITNLAAAVGKISVFCSLRDFIPLLRQFSTLLNSPLLHLAFVWSVGSYWKQLYQTLSQLERSFASGYHGLYQKCRKATFIGITVFALEAGLNAMLTLLKLTVDVKSIKAGAPARRLYNSTTDEVMWFLSRNMAMIAWSIQILFTVVVAHATILFSSLNQQMKTILSPDSPMMSVPIKLEKWRQNHVLVCQLVDCINDCFGLVLLLSITSYFINLIILSYKVFGDTLRYLEGDLVGFFLLNDAMLASGYFFHFVLIVMVPHKMQKHAMEVTETLRQYKNSDEPLQSRANGIVAMIRKYEHQGHSIQYRIDCLLNEVYNHRPQISALQFFNIDVPIFVVLFSTVLSYLLIIQQLSKEEDQHLTTIAP